MQVHVGLELEVPEDIPAECLGIYTFSVPYHHAIAPEVFRQVVAERFEQAAAEIRAGQHDPPPEEASHDG